MLSNHRELLVFSHLRWNFVFQRPQHLMTRFARDRRVFFFEEPLFESEYVPQLHVREVEGGVRVVTPYLPDDLDKPAQQKLVGLLLEQLVDFEGLIDYTAWYYTPMALPFTRGLKPTLIIYDVMDELSNFAFAPAEVPLLERELFKRAHLVFTGGHELYKAKRHLHNNIHPFPSSVDCAHFARARSRQTDPPQQRHLKHPRFGFFGVIDERLDLQLLAEVVARRPDYEFLMVGPVVKIKPETLPQAPNLHYLGQKDYRELPAYLSGWDAGIMPFAINAATRFISPTKTPEFLAAGLPVVCTPIHDVIRPYGELGLVNIAANANEFMRACDHALDHQLGCRPWQKKVDQYLAGQSWEITYQQMSALEASRLLTAVETI